MSKIHAKQPAGDFVETHNLTIEITKDRHTMELILNDISLSIILKVKKDNNDTVVYIQSAKRAV